MKSLSTIWSIFLLILFYSSNLFGQDNHTITLHVNTAEITEANLATTCNFGQPSNISNEDFNLDVRVGDEVNWEIKATDSNPRKADLVFIKYEKGRNVLQKGKIKDSNGRVKAKVKVGSNGEFEKYSIKFKVQGKGTFVIDPKLTIKN